MQQERGRLAVEEAPEKSSTNPEGLTGARVREQGSNMDVESKGRKHG